MRDMACGADGLQVAWSAHLISYDVCPLVICASQNAPADDKQNNMLSIQGAMCTQNTPNPARTVATILI